MSAFKVPEGPYTIEDIMQSIRAQLDLDAQTTDGPPSPGAVAHIATQEDWTRLNNLLERMQARQSGAIPYRIQSHRPIIGRVINLFKKVVYWSIRPYLDALCERQEAMNDLTVKALRELSQQMITEQKAMRQRYDTHSFFEAIAGENRLDALAHTRGAYWEVVERQNHYAELFGDVPGRVIDLGCGRGEMLAILQANAISAWGVDMDPLMVETARGKGLEAYEQDALTAVDLCEPASLGGLFAAQVIEHLFPGDLLGLIRLAADRLAPGGRLVLETINAASPGAMAKSYYQDLDHKQPVHPDYIKILLEQGGFEQVAITYLAPFSEDECLHALPPAESVGLSPEAHQAIQERFDHLNQFLFGFQDYYVTGVRPGKTKPDDGPVAR